MDQRMTEIKRGNSNIYPIGASASNITLGDGSILEEALGNINLAEKGDLVSQINNMASSFNQVYAPIVSPEFQDSIKLKDGANSRFEAVTKNDNSGIDVSITGDLTVSGVSKLGTIQNSSWEGNLPITGIISSQGDNVQKGVQITNSGIGFELYGLSGNDQEKTAQRENIQNNSSIIRNSRFCIHPGYTSDFTAKLYYRSDGIHSFIIDPNHNGTGTEIVSINSSGLTTNGKITCDSFSSPDTAKKVSINTLKTFVQVLTDYNKYPYGEPYCVRLFPIVTGYLRSGKTNETAFTAPGFAWKAGSAEKPSMYLFYFSTAGVFWSSHVTCEKVGSNYKKFSINTSNSYKLMASVYTNPKALPNPAT